MQKIFGIGWAKTGTTTLGACFRIFGYNHQSQDLSLVPAIGRGDVSQAISVARGKDSFEDWPWIVLYQELDRAFPGSKFILTRRDSASWLKSYTNMLANQDEASVEMNEIRRILYGLPFPNVTPDALVARYEQHNLAVQTYFRGRAETLLVVDWSANDGWRELCSFLGRLVPSDPFPHANRGIYQSRRLLEPLVRKARKLKV